MIKSCTLIPTHAPKFGWIDNLLTSYTKFVKQPHDFYIIFSNEIDAEDFKRITNNIGSYKELILPEELRDKKSIINVKKYYGLKCIANEYEYIGVYDSESEVVKECNLDLVYEDIASQTYFKSNKASIGGGIIKKIADMLNLSDNKILIEQTQNFSVYWWFQEIPVYKSHYFLEFYDWFIQLPNLDELQTEYYSFDFLVYSVWLICYKGYTIKNYDVPFEYQCGAVEEFRVPQYIKDLVTETFESYWDTNFENHSHYDKIKIIAHIDNWKK
jgi:hypothetical protein